MLMAAAGPAVGDDRAQRLERLQQAIESVSADIARTESKRKTASRELEQFDRQIARQARKLARLQADIDRTTRQLKRLRAQQRDILAQTRQHRQQLNRQARAAYLMGRQHPVKLLLQEEDPSRLGRMLVYYDYFNRHRLERLGALSGQLAKLQQIEQQLERENQRQQQLRQQYTRQQAELDKSRRQRLALIERLDRALEKSQQRLDKLRADHKRLAKLTQAIRQATPAAGAAQTRFAQLKGKLIWPVDGRIRHRYGSRRPTGSLRWQGLVIEAPSGTPVRAVADGEVVFAKWMRGFGFLIIVDHGGDYLSLYGHNQRLLKKIGDRVRQGDILATVGNSGGQKKPALYFEIRHRGKTINPGKWILARR